MALLLGFGMGMFALLQVVGGAFLLVAGRAWRPWGVACVVEGIGFGLFGLATAQDLRSPPLAVAALTVMLLGLVVHVAALLRNVRSHPVRARGRRAGEATS